VVPAFKSSASHLVAAAVIAGSQLRGLAGDRAQAGPVPSPSRVEQSADVIDDATEQDVGEKGHGRRYP
jgi:hypothetical protein